MVNFSGGAIEAPPLFFLVSQMRCKPTREYSWWFLGDVTAMQQLLACNDDRRLQSYHGRTGWRPNTQWTGPESAAVRRL